MHNKTSILNRLIRAGSSTLEEIEWDLSRNSDLIELQFGENQEDISARVLNAISEVGNKVNKYPNLLSDLIEVISKQKKIPEKEIVVVNGTDEAFRLISETFIERGNECLLFPPTYPSIKPGIQFFGGKLIKVPLTDSFTIPSIDHIRRFITPNTKIVYVANPNTPTGCLMATKAQIRNLLELSLLVVVDECYFELSNFSVSDLVEFYPNLAITRSFSKTYGLAGLRMGYIIANEELAKILRDIETSLEPFPPITSMVGTIAALEDEEHLNLNLSNLKSARQMLQDGLQSIGLIVHESQTTALLVDTSPLGVSAKEFVGFLSTFGILTKTCEVYDYSKDTWVYFGVPRLDQINRVLEGVRDTVMAVSKKNS